MLLQPNKSADKTKKYFWRKKDILGKNCKDKDMPKHFMIEKILCKKNCIIKFNFSMLKVFGQSVK